MKKILISFALLAISAFSFAQDANLEKIQELMVKNKAHSADSLMQLTLASPKTKNLQLMYNKAGLIKLILLQEEANKQGQGIPFDTLAFVKHIDDAIDLYTKSHNFTVTPNEKGKLPKVDPKVEEDTKARLMSIYSYPSYSAMFLLNQGDTLGALKYFQKYLDMPNNPAFTPAERDSLIAVHKEADIRTQFNVAFLYYNLKDWNNMIPNVDKALQNDFEKKNLYYMKRDAYLEMQDTAQWVNVLKEAATDLNEVSFLEEIVSYYIRSGKTDEAEALVNDMVANNPGNALTWYLKGYVELSIKENNAEARENFLKATEIDPNLAIAYINIGVTYYSDAVKRRMSDEFNFINKLNFKPDEVAMEFYKKEVATIRPDFDKAIDYLNKAKEIDPVQAPEANRRLRSIYSLLGTMYQTCNQKDEVAKLQGLINELEE